MKNSDYENENKKVEQLLTPKHSPQCRANFSVPTGNRKIMQRCIRISGIAALLVIAVIITKNFLVEEAKAVPSPLASIERALQELAQLQSMRVEFRANVLFSDYGLPASSDEQEELFKNGTLYYLTQNGKSYLRIEWDDKEKTTHLSDGVNETVWQGGKKVLEKKGNIRVLPDLMEIVNSHAVSKITPENIQSITVFQSSKRMEMKVSVPRSNEMFVLTFAIVPEEKGINVPELYVDKNNKEQSLLLEKAVLKRVNGAEEDTILETLSITYNYPVTREAIMDTLRLQ